MTHRLTEAAEYLAARGWTKLGGHFPNWGGFVVCNEFAIVAITYGEDLASVLSTREAGERILADLGKDPKASKDLYLLFLVEQLGSQIRDLQKVLDNTSLCRRLYIELASRPIADALGEVSVFADLSSGVAPEGHAIHELLDSSSEVAGDIVGDLIRMSAITFVEQYVKRY